MSEKPNEKKTVTEIIDDVCTEICSHYCKYPDECDEKAAGDGDLAQGDVVSDLRQVPADEAVRRITWTSS